MSNITNRAKYFNFNNFEIIRLDQGENKNNNKK